MSRNRDAGANDSFWTHWRYDRLSRRNALGLAAGGAASALLAGCRTGKSNGSGGSSAASQGGKPKYGGQINVRQGNEPVTYDTSTKLVDAARALTQTNDSLLGFKTGPQVKYQDLVIRPALAEKWETPDPSTYIFHLRSDGKFQNLPPVNGRAFDATDVKWTYEYMSRTGPHKSLPPAPAASMFTGIDRIEAQDPKTVVVRFGQPYAPFLGYAASQWIPILAHEIFDADGDFKQRAVGTGPWQMDVAASQKGTRAVHRKNPNYFMPARPYADQLNLLIITDQATVNTAFQAGQIDILDYSGLDGKTVEQMKKAVPNVNVEEFLEVNNPYYFYLNVSKPPLNDARVRKAISLSIDRDELIRTIFDGKGKWALAGGTADLFTQDEVKQILKYDPAQAKQLVEQAGYPKGVDVDYIYNAAYGESFVTIAQLLQSQFKKGGINITLKGLMGGEEAQRRRTGDYQLAITPRGQGVPQDIDSYVYGMFHPKSADNYGRINDPELTPLLESQRRELDTSKRREILRQAVRRINENVWSLTLFYGQGYNLTRPRLKNYAPNTAYAYGWVVTDSWVEQGTGNRGQAMGNAHYV